MSCRILLLDFGHPMTENTIKNIKHSLENSLSLLFNFYGNENSNTIFGISVLNSKYTLFGSYVYVKRKYGLIMTKVNNLDQLTVAKKKITIQKYKCLMSSSIESILKQLKKKVVQLSTEISLNKKSLEIVVITRKTASIVAEILVQVVDKLPENYFQDVSINHLKIIQITDEEEIHSFKFNQDQDDLVRWTTCKITDLDLLFKNWLIQINCQKRQVEIILSEDIELTLNIDVVPCSINPYCSPIPHISDALKPSRNLKIIHRILMSDINQSMIYGIPYTGYAANNPNLSWDRLQINIFIFIELCKELKNTNQGLIAKGSYSVGEHEIISYYCITSDGNSLFIKNLVPNELFSLQELESLQPQMEIDKNASLLVKSCLEKFDFLDEYHPSNFSSGLYDFLKKYMTPPAKKLGMLGHIDPELTSTDINFLPEKSKKKFRKYRKNIRNIHKELKPGITASQISQSSKKLKINSDLESYDTHPALLPPEIINKYQLYNPSRLLPELDF